MEKVIKIWTLSLMVVLFACGAVWANLTDGLIAHWKFDEGSGATAYDSAGTNHGTLMDDPQWTTGLIDGALDFDGADDYVECPAEPLNNISEGTLVVFVYPHSFYYPVVTKGTNTWTHFYLAISKNGNVVTHMGTSLYFSSRNLIPLNYWSMIAISWDGSYWKTYINGEFDSQTSASEVPINSSNPVKIGRHNSYSQSYYCDGFIDDVRVYDRALSAEEVKQIYLIDLGEFVSLEIVGAKEVAENFQAQYKAIAHYEMTDVDVTTSAIWWVDDEAVAMINENGLLTTEEITFPQKDIAISAEYTKGGIGASDSKNVTVFAICPSGYALEFDGMDDYVDCGNDNSLDINDVITVEAWVRRSSTNRFDYVVGKYETRYSRRSWMLIAGDNDSGYENDTGVIISKDGFLGGNHSTFLRGGSEITDTSWHHIAFTYKFVSDGSSELNLYLDGQLDLSSSNAVGPIYLSDIPVRIGVIAIAGVLDRHFNGTIDEVRIWKTVKTEAEIIAGMHIPLSSNEPDLVGYWRFDEGSGQVVSDSSGNGNNGILGSTEDVDDSDPSWNDSDAPIGICTPVGIIQRNITGAMDIKQDILEQLEIALGKEIYAQTLLREIQNEKDVGNLDLIDIIKARMATFQAVIDENQSRKKLNDSIEKLQQAVDSLEDK